ncbi:MAG TPA: hypothetical protein VG738_17285 [Chitinophagaceae bacterium]|nr:hypothetical protein [Chitinophagaceae bacterium]
MKLVTIVMIAVLTIIPVLRYKSNTLNNRAKKTQLPAKQTGKKRANGCSFGEMSLKFLLF